MSVARHITSAFRSAVHDIAGGLKVVGSVVNDHPGLWLLMSLAVAVDAWIIVGLVTR